MTEYRLRDLPLRWDVFVTPAVPVVDNELPPGENRRVWPPISSTLISGERDAVLVDAFVTAAQTRPLLEWVEASGKNLTMLYATHGHGDHFFGATTVLERFAHARFVATPEVVKVHAAAGITAVARVVLECTFPRTDLRSSGDCRRIGWEPH